MFGPHQVWLAHPPKGGEFLVCSPACAQAYALVSDLQSLRLEPFVTEHADFCLHCRYCGDRVQTDTRCVMCDGVGCADVKWSGTLHSELWAAEMDQYLGGEDVPHDAWVEAEKRMRSALTSRDPERLAVLSPITLAVEVLEALNL